MVKEHLFQAVERSPRKPVSAKLVEKNSIPEVEFFNGFQPVRSTSQMCLKSLLTWLTFTLSRSATTSWNDRRGRGGAHPRCTCELAYAICGASSLGARHSCRSWTGCRYRRDDCGNVADAPHGGVLRTDKHVTPHLLCGAQDDREACRWRRNAPSFALPVDQQDGQHAASSGAGRSWIKEGQVCARRRAASSHAAMLSEAVTASANVWVSAIPDLED